MPPGDLGNFPVDCSDVCGKSYTSHEELDHPEEVPSCFDSGDSGEYGDDAIYFGSEFELAD